MAKWAGSLHISILKAAKINKKTNIAKYFCPFCKKNYINIQTYIQQTTTFYGIPKISYLFSGQGGRPAPPLPPPYKSAPMELRTCLFSNTTTKSLVIRRLRVLTSPSAFLHLTLKKKSEYTVCFIKPYRNPY